MVCFQGRLQPFNLTFLPDRLAVFYTLLPTWTTGLCVSPCVCSRCVPVTACLKKASFQLLLPDFCPLYSPFIACELLFFRHPLGSCVKQRACKFLCTDFSAQNHRELRLFTLSSVKLGFLLAAEALKDENFCVDL